MNNFTEENGRLSQLFSSHDPSCLSSSELSTCLQILSKYISDDGISQGSRYYFKTSPVVDDTEYDRDVDSLAPTSLQDLRQQESTRSVSMFSLTALSILDALEQDHPPPEFNFDLNNIVDKHTRFVPEYHGNSLRFDFTI